MVRVGLTEKITFEQRNDGGEIVSHVATGGVHSRQRGQQKQRARVAWYLAREAKVEGGRESKSGRDWCVCAHMCHSVLVCTRAYYDWHPPWTLILCQELTGTLTWNTVVVSPQIKIKMQLLECKDSFKKQRKHFTS